MRVYFDYNATSPLAPEVIDAVARASRDVFGNASSVHQYGQQAKAVLDDARSEIETRPINNVSMTIPWRP